MANIQVDGNGVVETPEDQTAESWLLKKFASQNHPLELMVSVKSTVILNLNQKYPRCKKGVHGQELRKKVLLKICEIKMGSQGLQTCF